MNPIAQFISSPVAEEPRNCEHHGDYIAKLFGSHWSACPNCWRSEIDRIRRDDLGVLREQRRKARAEQLLAIANVPPRYTSAALTALPAVQAQKARAWVDAIAAGGSNALLILGEVGTGKTHAACALIREACDRGIHARYCRTFDLATRVRDTWGNAAQETAALAWFREPKILVIDEIGLGIPTEQDAQRLHALIDDRYNAAAATVLVTNLAPEKLAAHLGDRAADRLREGLHKIAFRGESRRLAGGL